MQVVDATFYKNDIDQQYLLLYLNTRKVEPWGDDWNDVPFEHNAGIVYDKFVTHKLHVLVREDVVVSSATDDYINSPWSVQTLMEQKKPLFNFTLGEQSVNIIIGEELDLNILTMSNGFITLRKDREGEFHAMG